MTTLSHARFNRSNKTFMLFAGAIAGITHMAHRQDDKNWVRNVTDRETPIGGFFWFMVDSAQAVSQSQLLLPPPESK